MSDKRESLRFLASLADRVPPEAREQIVPIARRIARREVPETLDLFDDPGDAAGEATNLILTLGAADSDAHPGLIDLLTGGSADRRWAAQVAARTEGPEHLGLLITLAADPDPTVRAAAGAGLATAVVTGDAGSLAERALEACIADPGALVPTHTAAALRRAGGEAVEALLVPLREHLSAHVRQAATGADV